MLRAIAIGLVFAVSVELCYGAGGCLNPMIGLSYSTFQTGYFNIKANFIWVYMIFPFFGSVLAWILMKLHIGAALEDIEIEDTS